MKRRSISHEPIPEIPFDLVIKILTRLPAKSLMRFKSVSKLWSSFICFRNFTILHLFPKLYQPPDKAVLITIASIYVFELLRQQPPQRCTTIIVVS
ncbi:unnamed protein product [Arabidopsis halleri]